MDLFGHDPAVNLLPGDGTVNYHGPILTPADARNYFEALLHRVPWKQDEAVIFGKHIITARKVAWYGDADYFYTYSGITKQALLWNPELLALKTTVEQRTGTKFNSCLLNHYHDGNEGMGWHSDHWCQVCWVKVWRRGSVVGAGLAVGRWLDASGRATSG